MENCLYIKSLVDRIFPNVISNIISQYDYHLYGYIVNIIRPFSPNSTESLKFVVPMLNNKMLCSNGENIYYIPDLRSQKSVEINIFSNIINILSFDEKVIIISGPFPYYTIQIYLKFSPDAHPSIIKSMHCQ